MGPKKAKKEVKPKEDDAVQVFGPGYGPLVVTSHTKELLGCEVGEGVTEERPAMFVQKEVLIDDMKKRAAISDFSVYKNYIMDYPEDEMLLVYDEEYKYNSFYYLCLTVKAKETAVEELQLEEVVEGEIGEGGEAGVEEEAAVALQPEVKIFYPYECIPGTWVSLGSEKEVEDEQVCDVYPEYCVAFQLRDGARRRKVQLSDALASENESMCLDLILSEEEELEPFITSLVLDVGVQTCLAYKDSAAMTIRPKYVGACNQYELVTFDSEQISSILNSASLKAFLKKVEEPMIKAIRENESTDLFKDEFAALGDFVSGEEELNADIQPDIYFTYTHGTAVASKGVSCVSVSPLVKGLFAISFVENVTPEEYVEQFCDIMFDTPCVFISSLCNLDMPKVILNTYEEVEVLSFNPTSPNLITGGTKSGLTLLWDLSIIKDFIVSGLKHFINKRKPSPYAIENLGDFTNLDETVIIRPAVVSSVESRHTGGIVYCDWLPSDINVEAGGETVVSEENECLQILTSGYDGSVRFWSFKKKYGGSFKESEYTTSDKQRVMFTNVKSTYSALDEVWKPFHAFRLPKASGVHSYLTCFIFKRKNFTQDSGKSEEKQACSHLIGGSSDGFVMDIDWLFQRNETGNFDIPRPRYYTSVEGVTIHDGPVKNISESPFMGDIFLSVGSSALGIWQKDLFDGPLLLHVDKARSLTAAAWSPSKPALFVVSTDDGEISTWNLLKGNPMEPVMIHKYPVIKDDRQITNIQFMQSLEGEELQMYYGTFPLLPLIKIPECLCHPEENELEKVREVLNHEVKRVKKLSKFHSDLCAKKAADIKRRAEEEKMERERPQKKESAIEIDERTDEQKEKDALLPKYERFLESERNFMIYVGLLVPEEPSENSS